MFLRPRLFSGADLSLPVVGLIFLLGTLTGAAPFVVRSAARTFPRPPERVEPLLATTNAAGTQLAADVIRVIDGDTFEARVHAWPGIDITTRVRLRGIDAPEMKANCRDEAIKAEAAKLALQYYLSRGDVRIARIVPDKYGGRVVADVMTASTPDVSMALLEAGHARRYAGGRRDGWCGYN